MNPIIVDGCGMCGACRVTVGDKTKFACLGGSEFEENIVDFDELIKRLSIYKFEENQALGARAKCFQAIIVLNLTCARVNLPE